MPRPWDPFLRLTQKSIGTRIIALGLLLLLVVQVATLFATSASMERHARSVLPDELLVGERVFLSLIEQQAHKLAEGGRLLAADYGFRSAVLSKDEETVASVLANHGARIGATEVLLLGTDFMLQAASGDDVQAMVRMLPALTRVLSTRPNDTSTPNEILLVKGKPHQVVMLPVRAPVLMGWLLLGFPLEARLADDMRQLSALNITLLTRSQVGGPWSSALSSLPTSVADGLARQRWAPRTAADPGMLSVELLGEEIGVRPVWLSSPTGGMAIGQAPAAPIQASLQPALAGEGPAVVALVSVSVDEAIRPPPDLQLALLAITLLGFVAFAIGSTFTARRVTQPLRELAVASERLGAGDYTTPIGGARRLDEIGELAGAFERMRINVGEKQEQIAQLAYWDNLTHLPNRAQFRKAVGEAIAHAKGGNHMVAVLMLDLDRFKHVNDVLGYRLGDLLLSAVAERLGHEVVRGDDMVARLGGDEFAVLLRHGDPGLAESVSRRILAAFQEPLILEEHTVDMGAGIGMACWPQHASDADMLLSRAEVAMYAAKRRSAGPLMYDASFDAGSAQTLSLLTELRRALDNNELRLFLQPKLALETSRVVGAETLVRWQHPTRGMVPPMQFIPFAEQTGFIRALTMWVFEEAARHWLLLLAEGLELRLSVNLSTRDLLDQDLPQKFDALLIKHRVPAEAFCLEITESAIMDDPQRALGTLERLSGMGFKLSIDDFGTGYSSLAYLKRLPVDELKIDKSFVMSMETDLDDAKIVRSTIDLAHNLGLTVVAEGVENAQCWDMLRQLDCDEAQGYHMGRPMPATDFHSWSSGWMARQRQQAGLQPMALH